MWRAGLPRETPAASLKLTDFGRLRRRRRGLPRETPAASLKQRPRTRGRQHHPRAASSAGNSRGLIEAGVSVCQADRRGSSSAGNSRGLIEAGQPRFRLPICVGCLPRETPAASLKRRGARRRSDAAGRSLPRETPAASLKRRARRQRGDRERTVFRGKLPRPH